MASVLQIHHPSLQLGIVKTNSYFLHCAYIPLLCNEKVAAEIKRLERTLNVKIAFTDHYLSSELTAGAIAGLSQPLFRTQQIKDIVDHINSQNNIAACATLRKPKWYCSFDNTHANVLLPDTDATILENLFQFGGNCITLSGDEFIVNFNESKLISKSGRIGNIRREPSFMDAPLQNLKFHISGQDSNIKRAENNLLQVLNGNLVETVPIPCCAEMTLLLDLLQQVRNIVRQYCVLFKYYTVDGVSKLSLTGAPGYVEVVHELIEQHISALAKDLMTYRCRMVLFKQFITLPFMSKQEINQYSRPPIWELQTKSCVFGNVIPNSNEWKEMFTLVSATMPGILLKRLERIQNVIIWEKYSLEGKHMSKRNEGVVNEKYLYHGTCKVNPYIVASSDCGIDFRYSKEHGRPLMWGTGAYFAENLSYSDKYSHKVIGKERQVMIVSVLTGRSYTYGKQINSKLTMPPNDIFSGRRFDTVNGTTGGSIIYVIYDHYKSCPAYIITYNIPEQQSN